MNNYKDDHGYHMEIKMGDCKIVARFLVDTS